MSSTFGPTSRYKDCDLDASLGFEKRVLVLDVVRDTGINWRTIAKVIDSLQALGYQVP